MSVKSWWGSLTKDAKIIYVVLIVCGVLSIPIIIGIIYRMEKERAEEIYMMAHAWDDEEEEERMERRAARKARKEKEERERKEREEKEKALNEGIEQNNIDDTTLNESIEQNEEEHDYNEYQNEN